MHHDELIISQCLREVENQLGWGPGKEWTTNDFKALSEKIHAATGTHLSVATLKRLWGTIDYKSSPTATTLNALAQFVGYENWRAYKFAHHSHNGKTAPESATPEPGGSRPLFWWLGGVSAVVFCLLVYTFYWSVDPSPNAHVDVAKFSFSSKKMTSVGVPNSVIFEYSATEAGVGDSVFIQQTWDKRLRQRVPADKTVHTSIYYYPGYFQAKLVWNDSIVREHPLYITTDGWLPMVEQEKVPVYFDVADVVAGNGIMALPLPILEANNIPMQPETPWISYFNVRTFEGLQSDNFAFETEVRSDFNRGAGVCSQSEVQILLKGGALIVPLAIPGCVSGLAVYDLDGKREDPTPLGVDLSQWVKVRYEVQYKTGKIFIDNKLAYDSLNLNFGPVDIVGLRLRFQGTGSVNYVRLWDKDGKVVYSDEFGGNGE